MGNSILIIINNLSTGTEGTQWQEAIQKADSYLGSMKTPPSGRVSGKESVSWAGAASLRFKRAVGKDLPKTSQTHKPSCLDNAKKKWPEAHTQGQRLPTEPFSLLLEPCLRGPPENNFLLQLKSWQDFPTEGHKANVWAICSGHNKCTLCEDSLRGDLWVQTHCVQ